jgi:hypothetical protein
MSSSSSFDVKWFAREVRSISVRNMRMPMSSSSDIIAHVPTSPAGVAAIAVSTLPNPWLEVIAITNSHERTALYTSRVVPSCSNPSWTMAAMLPSTDAWKVDTKVILFQIHDEIRPKNPTRAGNGQSKSTHSSPLLITVDLSSLIALGSIQLINISALPINALLLSTDSGYYVTAAVYEKLKGAGADVGTNSRVVVSYDDSENDATESSGEMRAKMDATMCSIEGLRVRATESLQNMGATRQQILKQSKWAALDKVG